MACESTLNEKSYRLYNMIAFSIDSFLPTLAESFWQDFVTEKWTFDFILHVEMHVLPFLASSQRGWLWALWWNGYRGWAFRGRGMSSDTCRNKYTEKGRASHDRQKISKRLTGKCVPRARLCDLEMAALMSSINNNRSSKFARTTGCRELQEQRGRVEGVEGWLPRRPEVMRQQGRRKQKTAIKIGKTV